MSLGILVVLGPVHEGDVVPEIILLDSGKYMKTFFKEDVQNRSQTKYLYFQVYRASEFFIFPFASTGSMIRSRALGSADEGGMQASGF